METKQIWTNRRIKRFWKTFFLPVYNFCNRARILNLIWSDLILEIYFRIMIEATVNQADKYKQGEPGW